MSDPIVYLARHGETDLNKKNAFRSWSNPPLNKTGMQEARNMCEHLDGLNINRVITDDLKRTKQTATILASYIALEPEIDSDLRPWNLGDLAGKSKDDNAAILDKLLKNPDARPPGDSESLNEFTKRNTATMNQYFQAATKDGPYLLVVHTSNIVNLIEGEELEKSDIVDPGDLLSITLDDDGGYTIAKMPCCGQKPVA